MAAATLDPSPARAGRSVCAPLAGECGQALALAALALGLVALPLCVGAVGLALAVGGRASLDRAVAAAALGTAAGTAVSLDLKVSFTDYLCVPARRGNPCAAEAGSTIVAVGAASAADAPEVGFGPVPGWAAAAGCVGTVWPGGAAPGTYRVCRAQRLTGAQVTATDPAGLRRAAQWWLSANLAGDPQLQGVQLVSVTEDAAGAVTVTASADLRPSLPLLRSVEASATAWPGGVG